jgi:3-oxoacyl-[acyl-carrier protein] reductase
MPEANPVALISGDPAGLGRALVSCLTRQGHDVAFCRTSPAGDADDLAGQAGATAGGRLLLHHAEIAGEIEAKELVAEVEARLGPPAALVTCAGGPGAAAGEPPWTIELDRVYQLCRAVVMGFIRRRSGRIVIVVPPPRDGEDQRRAAVAAGMQGFALALARECGRYGVRVNAVCPGYLDDAGQAGLAEDARARLARAIPAGRLGTEQEVAELVAFLVSGRADYLHGQVLRIDGGLEP